MHVRQLAPKNLPNWRSENTIQNGFVKKKVLKTNSKLELRKKIQNGFEADIKKKMTSVQT